MVVEWIAGRGHVAENKKHDSASEETFLNTAARAVGTTLGKLATKTGLALPGEKPKVPRPASGTPRKKKAASNTAKLVRKAVAKKKTTAKKMAHVATKTKR
jgi:hypothetical protein